MPVLVYNRASITRHYIRQQTHLTSANHSRLTLKQAKVPEPGALSRNTEHPVMVSQAVLQKGQRMSGNLARWFNGSHCIKMIIIFC